MNPGAAITLAAVTDMTRSTHPPGRMAAAIPIAMPNVTPTTRLKPTMLRVGQIRSPMSVLTEAFRSSRDVPRSPVATSPSQRTVPSA